MEGWIKIHRSLLDWEWYSDTNCVRLCLHFLLKANYQSKKWKGITIDRGQLITSRGQLSEETGLSEMQIRTSLDKLDNCGFITKLGTRKYTIITVCNYDSYQQGQDGYDNGYQPTDNQQITNNQPTDNQQITTTKEYKKERIEEYTHTLVDTKKGVVGGNAAELVRWIHENVPTIASMPEPITEANAVWMLRKYSVEDIQRLIVTMHSKGAYTTNKNAYATFVTYAKLDRTLTEHSGVKYYTYDEAMAQVYRLSGQIEDHFVREAVNGQWLWRRKHFGDRGAQISHLRTLTPSTNDAPRPQSPQLTLNER